MPLKGFFRMPPEQSLWSHHLMSRSVLLLWGGDTARGTARVPALLLQGISITRRALPRDTAVLSLCPCVPESAFAVLRPGPGPWHSEQGVRPAEG